MWAVKKKTLLQKKGANKTDTTLLKLHSQGYLERGNKREDET